MHNTKHHAKKVIKDDKGLILTKDDGPWHMLRRNGVP